MASAKELDLASSDLTGEVAARLAYTTWDCGASVAQQIYAEIKSDKSNSQATPSDNPDCTNSANKLTIALDEVKSRHDKATVSNDFVDGPLTYSHFNLILPTVVSSAPTESGDESCLVQARKLYERWQSDLYWPPLDKAYSTTYDTTKVQCMIERHGNEDRSFAICSYWLSPVIFDFTNGSITMTTRDVRYYSDADKARQKQISNEAKRGGKVDIREEMNLGTHYIFALTFVPGLEDATIQLKGIDGATWTDGIIHIHSDGSRLNTKCVMKTQLKIKSTPLAPGRIE